MSVIYRGVHWNRQKRIYDATLAAFVVASVSLFAATTILTHPNWTIETLLIRSTSWTAIVLLHVILCIGPMARLDSRFLPLLYNRRHLGVTMFFLAAAHGVLAVFQFHALGGVNPLVSALTAYDRDLNPFIGPGRSVSQFPFEPFGALALAILFLMAATSHDFWLRNLGASCWKLMHMLVYVAYGSILVHVAYGVLQSERSPVYIVSVAAGFFVVVTLHVLAARKESALDRARITAERDGYKRACRTDEIREDRGKAVKVGGERVAVFRHEGRVFALSNVCRHQGGPVGEGRIQDGCVTCPWHGWQYKPDDGCSPPPFDEVIPTYNVRVIGEEVFVHPTPNAPRTSCPGAPADGNASDTGSSDDFYIGYQKKAPRRLARRMQVTVAVLAVLVPVLTIVMASAQSPFDHGRFEFGTKRSMEGVLYEEPIPMLHLTKESRSGAAVAVNYLLVGPGKSGMPDYARGHGGKKVRFNGSLIYRENMAMIEMNDQSSFQVLGEPSLGERAGRTERVGHVRLTGELVDTKCFFGVMRPATGKVHRACAVRCLSGGAPPGLLIRQSDGAAVVVLLAGQAGRKLALDHEWAALNVSAEGTLELHDGTPVLRTEQIALADRHG